MDTETVVTISDPIPTTSTTQNEERIAQLTAELDHANAELKTARIQRDDYIASVASDFSIISDALIAEADKRGWCDQYDYLISEVNGKLRYGHLRERTRMFTVEVSIRGEVYMIHEIEVEASSQEDADAKVSDAPYDYMDIDGVLSDHVRWNSFDENEVEVR